MTSTGNPNIVGNAGITLAPTINNSSPTNSPTPTAEVVTSKTSSVSGKITKIESNKITIDRGNNETTQITIPDSIKIKRDSNADAKFADLKINDTVTATITPSDEVVSIDAQSDKSGLLWIIPVILVILGLLSLYFLLAGKARKGKIKTSVN